MPISKWLCIGCGGREVPLTHFAETVCGERVHPDFAAAILKDRSDQYVTGKVRVSMGLGCPRRAAIEESEPFAIDPLEANAMATGTAWHAWVEDGGKSSGLVEVELSGTLGGVAVAGKTDRLRQLFDGSWAVEDWKHVNDFGLKFVKPGPKPEHQVQAALYAELVPASTGLPRPESGIIWYHASVGGRDALTPHRFKLMPVDDALSHRPYDCEYTVQELLQQAADFFTSGPEMTWRSMPMAGKSIKFGTKSGCDYCSVREICWTADKGAPF